MRTAAEPARNTFRGLRFGVGGLSDLALKQQKGEIERYSSLIFKIDISVKISFY